MINRSGPSIKRCTSGGAGSIAPAPPFAVIWQRVAAPNLTRQKELLFKVHVTESGSLTAVILPGHTDDRQIAPVLTAFDKRVQQDP